MFRSLFVCAAVIAALLPISAPAADASATLNGTVRTPDGAPVAAAQVIVSGPEHRSAATDAAGAFSFTNLTPGVYRVDVNKGGYVPAVLNDVALIAGETLPVTVSLVAADLSSLKTIARVSVGRGSSINTGAAATTFTTREAFTQLANPQINNVVARIPGAGVERGSSSPNTSISLGGAQPYETQILLDGHPLSAGRYGVWFSQYFNSALLDGIETQTGPGNTTPFAATAIGGTANLVTPGFTAKPSYEFTAGVDSYGSQYSNLLTTGAVSKLSYVLGLAYGSSDGPYFRRQGCVITPQSPKNDNTPGATGIIQFCGDLSGSLFSKGEVFKLKYDFSPSTSFEAGYVGSQSGFHPQGTGYGNYAGVTTIVPCLANRYACTNPSNAGYIGKGIDGLVFYPGSNVYNQQPIFTGQLRTAIGDNTLLVRPYAGNISRIIDGSGESDYPLFFYPSSAANDKKCAGAPNYGLVGPSANGMTECKQGPFSVLEFDKLHGTTVSFLHPFGTDVINFTYDYHSDDTFAYYNTPSDVVVPDTIARFNSLSLTGDIGLRENVRLKAGLYDTVWKLHGVQYIVTPTSKMPAPLDRTTSRFDPHLALVFQPKGGVSYRLAFGTSATFPYASLVSGTTSVERPSGTDPFGHVIEKNPFLKPEVATSFDIGADKRFHNGSLLSFDIQSMSVRDVIETLSQPDPTLPNYFDSLPINAARLNSLLAMLRYSYSPVVGLGYDLTLTANRSIIEGVPDTAYSSPKVFVQPANGVQQCSNGGNEICIPYLKAYGELTYTLPDRTLFLLGADFEGKNNTYNQKPFTIYNLAIQRPITKMLALQLSVENLLNTNNSYYLAMPNAGVPQIGQSAVGLGSIPAAYLPAPPRTLRLQLRWHVNR